MSEWLTLTIHPEGGVTDDDFQMARGIGGLDGSHRYHCPVA